MITISIYSWLIPGIITICLVGYALFIYDDGGGYCSGMGNILLLVPALAISLAAWITWGIFR